MATFLTAAINHIEAVFPGKSTVGHRFLSDVSGPFKFPTSAIGSIPQVHYYNKRVEVMSSASWEPASYLFNKSMGDALPIDPLHVKDLFTGTPKPILGEFDSDHNGFGPAWSELGSSDSTLARLKLLESVGCGLALIWGDDYSDATQGPDNIKLLPDTRQAIVNYTGGTLLTNGA